MWASFHPCSLLNSTLFNKLNPSYLFTSMTNDTFIIGPTFICFSGLWSFCILIAFGGVDGPTPQVHNQVDLWLAFRFSLLVSFCIFLDGIKVLGVPFGSLSFVSSFFYDVLNDNVSHIEVYKTSRFPFECSFDVLLKNHLVLFIFTSYSQSFNST